MKITCIPLSFPRPAPQLRPSPNGVILGCNMTVQGWLLIAVTSLGAGLATAQEASQSNARKKDESKKDAPAQPKPAPLFGGKLGIKSSDKTKESATMGFNGIDPSGKVDAKMLATAPTAADAQKLKDLAAKRPTAADLAAFLKDGGLNQR